MQSAVGSNPDRFSGPFQGGDTGPAFREWGHCPTPTMLAPPNFLHTYLFPSCFPSLPLGSSSAPPLTFSTLLCF